MDIAQVRAMALLLHGNQKYGDKPYIAHLDNVEAIIREYGYGDSVSRQAALLHDVLEDTVTTTTSLYKFGVSSEVINIIQFCTDESGNNREIRKALTYKRWENQIRVNPPWLIKAIRVKLADRLANLRFSLLNSPSHLQLYHREEKIFKVALYIPSTADKMWEEYDRLLV
jgi:(p)ppGpp synthase/HD superfamily hydrolase